MIAKHFALKIDICDKLGSEIIDKIIYLQFLRFLTNI